MNGIYHSALQDGLQAPFLSGFEINGSKAFVHDFTKPLPADFNSCDVFYTEPPWQTGIKIFDERAGITTSGGFRIAMKGIANIIESFPHIPVVLLLGQTALRYLPKPKSLIWSRLVKRPAIAAVFNVPMIADWTDEFSITRSLAEQFNKVGDFACGYGNVAIEFYQHGKQFVASDYNGHCIGKLYQRLQS